MWRKILVSLLLAAIMQTQMMAVAGDPQAQPAPPVQSVAQIQPAEMLPATNSGSSILADVNSGPWAPVVSSYRRYDQLRRGREEEVAVLLCRSDKIHFCPVSTLPQFGLFPESLELKPAEGITVLYRQGDEFRTQPQGAAVRTGIGNVFRLKIRADKNAALGDHLLEGRLTFRSARPGGTSETGQIDILIPITVVEHDAPVHKARWSLDGPAHNHVMDIILITITLPLWLPSIAIFWAWCQVHADDCH